MGVAFQFDFRSTLAAITYLSSKELPELTKYKICKLLFLADKYHLVTYGRVITGDQYCAIPYGPIPSRTLNILNSTISQTGTDAQSVALSEAVELDKSFEHPRFRAVAAYDTDALSQSDIAALDKVIADYGRMGFGELKAITHSMFAYKKAWTERPEGHKAADMDFEAFFEEDSDAMVGAREAMLEDDLLRKTFSAA